MAFWSIAEDVSAVITIGGAVWQVGKFILKKLTPTKGLQSPALKQNGKLVQWSAEPLHFLKDLLFLPHEIYRFARLCFSKKSRDLSADMSSEKKSEPVDNRDELYNFLTIPGNHDVDVSFSADCMVG